MVKLKKIKLSNQIECELREREMNLIFGGTTNDPFICSCGCNYADSGGSSSVVNGVANANSEKDSRGENTRCFIKGGTECPDKNLEDWS